MQNHLSGHDCEQSNWRPPSNNEVSGLVACTEDFYSAHVPRMCRNDTMTSTICYFRTKHRKTDFLKDVSMENVTIMDKYKIINVGWGIPRLIQSKCLMKTNLITNWFMT